MEIPNEVRQFYETAKEFCRWSEEGPFEDEDEAYTALRLVSSIYHQALTLPGVNCEDDELSGEGITKLDSKHIHRRFGSLPFQYYFEVFHPVTKKPEEPVTGDIADDLMDIYIDLKEGMLLYEKDKPTNAVWQWSFTFGVHWGRHATSVLRALHCYQTDAA
ncbi:MAG: DUF5063 domain-containing protein [Desulfomonilaceae bacterium]